MVNLIDIIFLILFNIAYLKEITVFQDELTFIEGDPNDSITTVLLDPSSIKNDANIAGMSYQINLCSSINDDSVTYQEVNPVHGKNREKLDKSVYNLVDPFYFNGIEFVNLHKIKKGIYVKFYSGDINYINNIGVFKSFKRKNEENYNAKIYLKEKAIDFYGVNYTVLVTDDTDLDLDNFCILHDVIFNKYSRHRKSDKIYNLTTASEYVYNSDRKDYCDINLHFGSFFKSLKIYQIGIYAIQYDRAKYEVDIETNGDQIFYYKTWHLIVGIIIIVLIIAIIIAVIYYFNCKKKNANISEKGSQMIEATFKNKNGYMDTSWDYVSKANMDVFDETPGVLPDLTPTPDNTQINTTSDINNSNENNKENGQTYTVNGF